MSNKAKPSGHSLQLAVIVACTVMMCFGLAIGMGNFYLTDKYLNEENPLKVTYVNGKPDDLLVTRPGGFITFKRTVCSSKELFITVNRVLRNVETDEQYHFSNIEYHTLQKEGVPCDIDIFGTNIPKYVEPGDYEYIPTLVYNINDLNRKVVSAPAIIVRVLP